MHRKHKILCIGDIMISWLPEIYFVLSLIGTAFMFKFLFDKNVLTPLSFDILLLSFIISIGIGYHIMGKACDIEKTV